MEKKKLTVLLERPEINQRYEIIIVPVHNDVNFTSKGPSSPEGNTGVYHVAIILASPGKQLFVENIDVDETAVSGDSMLEMPDNTDEINVSLVDSKVLADIRFTANSQRRISIAHMRVQAATFKEAEKYTLSKVLPLLSWWSFKHDVGIEVKGYIVREEATEVKKWSFGFEGKIRRLRIDDLDMKIKYCDELRPILASYREALCSTNSYYKFLSFFKVTEGIFNLRKARGEHTSERIPENASDLPVSDPALVELIKPYLGRKFTFVFDQKYRTMVRNAVAHIDPEKKVLDADDYDSLVECESAIPTMWYMAREMVRSEMKSRYGVAP